MILGESDSSSIKRLPPLKSTEKTGPRPRYLILALKYEKNKEKYNLSANKGGFFPLKPKPQANKYVFKGTIAL